MDDTDELDDKHANEVLRAARVAGGAALSEIQASTGLPAVRVYDLLGRLMASGLVVRRNGWFASASRSR